jgi:hypothetical protein
VCHSDEIPFGMNFENMGPAFNVRKTKLDLSVDSARPKEGGIQGTWSIGSEHDLNISSWIKPIKLSNQLKHCPLYFIVAACTVVKARATNGIDFVKEDDASFLCPGHFKEFSNHSCSFPNVSELTWF